MLYLLLKTLHLLSATVLFGTGLGSAYYLWRALRTDDAHVVGVVAGLVVQADWWFTTPTILIQPLTGAWLVHLAGYSWNAWLLWTVGLYALAGLCWLPVVWLQLRLRDLARESAAQGTPLSARHRYYGRLWFWLGVPAFSAMVAVYFLMVFKPAP